MADKEARKDIGGDEAWYANVKRTYDEFLSLSLDTARRNQLLFDKLVTDAQQYDNQRQAMANQALQNAVETANMVGKQAVRHSDIAIDRQWNVDEQGYTAADILQSNTFKDAVAAAASMVSSATAAAVADALNKAKQSES